MALSLESGGKLDKEISSYDSVPELGTVDLTVNNSSFKGFHCFVWIGQFRGVCLDKISVISLSRHDAYICLRVFKMQFPLAALSLIANALSRMYQLLG